MPDMFFLSAAGPDPVRALQASLGAERVLWTGRCAVAEYAFEQPASLPRWTLPEETQVAVTETRVAFVDPSGQAGGELHWPGPQHLRVQPGNRDTGRSATVTQIQLVCAGPDGTFPALVFAGGDLSTVGDADRLANVLRQSIARYRVERAAQIGLAAPQARMLSRLVIGPEFNNYVGGEGQTVTLLGAIEVARPVGGPVDGPDGGPAGRPAGGPVGEPGAGAVGVPVSGPAADVQPVTPEPVWETPAGWGAPPAAETWESEPFLNDYLSPTSGYPAEQHPGYEPHPYAEDSYAPHPYSDQPQTQQPQTQQPQTQYLDTSHPGTRYPATPDSRGQSLNGHDPYESASSGRDPYAHDPNGQNPYTSQLDDRNPYAQDVNGQTPYAQGTSRQDSYGQDSYSQDSYSQGSYVSDSYGPQSYGSDSQGAGSFAPESNTPAAGSFAPESNAPGAGYPAGPQPGRQPVPVAEPEYHDLASRAADLAARVANLVSANAGLEVERYETETTNLSAFLPADQPPADQPPADYPPIDQPPAGRLPHDPADHFARDPENADASRRDSEDRAETIRRTAARFAGNSARARSTGQRPATDDYGARPRNS